MVVRGLKGLEPQPSVTMKVVTRLEKEVTNTKFLENLTVTTPDGELVLMSSLWKNKDVVLKILPRLGCRMCKYEARSLGELRMLTDTTKVALAAVCFESPDLQTFLSNGYWDWEIFLDNEREVYKKANLHRLTKWQLLKNIFTKRVHKMHRFVKDEYDYGNSKKGDVYQLGGTFVIEKGGKVLFQFRPHNMAMFPSLKEIYKCLGGEPDDIDETTPPEHIFSLERCKFKTNLLRTSFFTSPSIDPQPI